MIFDRVLDTLGAAIVDGSLPAGHTESIDGFVSRTGASRSIVREAVRVLVALGLLSAGRRVGLRVLPPRDWDVLDPRVIGWRLAGPDRAAALVELRELRRAIEPAAAASAAAAVAASRPFGTSGRSGGDALEALLAAADRLAADAGHDDGRDDPRRPVAWAEADQELHRLVFELSGNAVYGRLHRVVSRALAERAGIGPDPAAVDLHVQVAGAVAAGDATAAADAMRAIIDRA